jgi:arabinofuranan 3-O-arabinosyltransferase
VSSVLSRHPFGSKHAIPLILTVGAFVLAFLQRPGEVFTDSRVELSADAGLFLHRIAAVWSPTTDLGHVQSGQFVGYLVPIGPWFAFAQAIGIPTWVAERLWIGALLSLAAWGVVVLMDDLYSRRRGVPHVVAAVLFSLNPYVLTFAGRASVALSAYVAMPWLMVAAHRGLREPRRWLWPAVFGLALGLGAGGVNAAFLPWVVAGPALLVLYEIVILRRLGRHAWSFGWRATLATLVASSWWIVPVVLQSRYGGNFLSFLEQPDAIWSTSSMAEGLRLLGYWVFYFGTGYFGGADASVSIAAPYLFNPAVIVATFAVPILAGLGLVFNRGWRYAPFFAFLAIFALLVMGIGFPVGKPFERFLSDLYYQLTSLQFLRTTYKAAPGVALGFACLAGAAVASLYTSLRSGMLRILGRRIPRWAPLVLAGLVVLGNAWPAFAGTAVDGHLVYKVPGYWRSALRDVDRTTARDHRSIVLPGQLFSWYRWGETITSIAPALAHRPVVVRQASLYADPRANRLLTATDDLVQQSRLVPGQLRALLGLMAVDQVIVAADGIPSQTGEADPATAAQALSGTLPPERPTQAYGSVRRYVPTAGLGGNPLRLPDIRRYLLVPPGPGVLRLHPQTRSTIMDGDAQGVTELAAVGALDVNHALFYAADLNRAALRAQVNRGATLVFTDSNRHQYVSGSRTTENTSETLGPDDKIPASLPTYQLFGNGNSSEQTVALYSGVRGLTSPPVHGGGLTPQYRPYAAFDGRLDTTWLASSPAPADRWLKVAFQRPHAIPALRIHTHADLLGGTSRVAISVNGEPERYFTLREGWTTIPLARASVRSLRFRVASVVLGPGLGGFDEIRIRGVRIREVLRLPRRLASMTAGFDLSHTPMSIVLQRVTADRPYQAGGEVESAQAGNALDDVDAEPGIARQVTLPQRRTFGVGGWSSIRPTTPDDRIDRLVGMPRGWRFLSSGRFEGTPIRRASSAFDGDLATGWIGNYVRNQFAWISVQAPHRFRVRRFRLLPVGPSYAFPTLLLVRGPHGYRRQVRVVNGIVRLPKAITTTRLRLDILGLSGPLGPRALRAVGISEIEIPGLRPPHPRRVGTFTTPCGDATIVDGASRATTQVAGTVRDLDAGGPLALRGCGRSALLMVPAHSSVVVAGPGRLTRPDHLRLSTPAPEPLPLPPPSVLEVTDPGKSGNGDRTNARMVLGSPAWLVLAEGYSHGWRASCTSASGKTTALGQPIPIDGYANGWRVGPSCRRASFTFAPQTLADSSYLVSALGALVLLLLIIGEVAVRRSARVRTVVIRGRRLHPGAPLADPLAWAAPPVDPVRRLPWTGVVLVALAAGGLGCVFAFRAGLAVALGTLVLLRIGVSARRLLALSLLGLFAIPLAYLASPAPSEVGFYFYYSLHFITAHWIAVGVVCALLGATLLMSYDVAQAGAWATRRLGLPRLAWSLNRRATRRKAGVG